MKKTAALLIALGLALPAMSFGEELDRPPRRDGQPPRELNRDRGPREGEARDDRRTDARPRDEARRDGGTRNDGPRGGPVGDRPHMPPPPLFAALDVNHDGVIDEKEMKDAADSLRKLDKNNDGKLTMDELRPHRPDGDRADANQGPRDDRHPPRDGDRGSDVAPRHGDHGPADRDGGRETRRGPRPPQDR